MDNSEAEENISEHQIIFHGHEDVDEDIFSYLMENWVQSNFRTDIIPTNLFDNDTEPDKVCVKTKFQDPSIERLLQNACIGKYSDTCINSIQNIINMELLDILRIASKIRHKKILSRIDIINALKILGIFIPGKIES